MKKEERQKKEKDIQILWDMLKPFIEAYLQQMIAELTQRNREAVTRFLDELEKSKNIKNENHEI